MQCVGATSAENGRPEWTDLAVRFAGGDDAAFAQIVALYKPRVASLAYRLLGYRGELDDVVQDVFLAALENRRRFGGRSTLWTWLTRITLNRCRSHWRRERVRRMARRLLPIPPAAAGADQGCVAGEKAASVAAALGQLPWRDREMLVLHYFEDLPLAQVAAMLGQRLGTVKVGLHRARQRLRERLPAGMMED